MFQTNDMVPVRMVNRDGAEVLFYNGADKVMARIILQELMKHDSRSVQG